LEKPDFRSVSLKTELVEAIEDYIKDDKRYRSVPEFLAEAARMRLEELSRLKKEA
jgi:metal-responsive CopG/Arc/MetJ family transcriptional regulator